MPQGRDEVGVHAGHRLLGRHAGELRAKQLLLEVGVVEFGVGVGQFHARHVELEPLGDVRLARLPLGERADRGRIVDHEHRAVERLFDRRLEEVALDHVGMAAGGLHAGRCGRGGHAGRIGWIAACHLADQVVVFRAAKRRSEIDRPAHPLKPRGRPGNLCGLDDDRLSEVHHRAVIAVGLVGLEHRELGVVPGAHAFVAVDAAEFEDTLHAADEQPLEMELKRDAEHQWHVERVVMGGERPRGGAAGGLLERRPFDLEIASRGQHATDRFDDPAASHKPVADALAVDEVEVSHPLPQFGINEAVVLVGGRFQRLREELEVRDEHRHLARLRPAEPAVHADDVAEVEAVNHLPDFGANLLLPEHQLDASGAVVEVDEHEAAGVPQQHDPPRDADGRPVVGRLVDALAPGPHVSDRHDVAEPLSPGVDAHGHEAVELASPRLFKLRGGPGGGFARVTSGRGCGLFRVRGVVHGRRSWWDEGGREECRPRLSAMGTVWRSLFFPSGGLHFEVPSGTHVYEPFASPAVAVQRRTSHGAVGDARGLVPRRARAEGAPSRGRRPLRAA